MNLELRWSNCLWLLLPLLIWNLVLGPRLSDPRLTSDANSAAWQLVAENLLRFLVFGLPILIPLQLRGGTSKIGLLIYILGTLVYFASWLPLLVTPGYAWSRSMLGALVPFLTPLAVFWGIALIGSSWEYAIVATAFTFMHVWHGVQNVLSG